ncbi:MAG: hypothetical protein P4M08_14630 [Oligoflexia bacterium]|nr:hypothetical protein [Oligoflexia bacterium]
MTHPWKVYLLRRESALSENSRFYEAAYAAWQSVWSPVLKEVADMGQLHSDPFIRQDEILTLFRDDEVAAMTFLTRVDLSKKCFQDDSYFQYWPELAIQSLTRYGTDVLVCSNFTVMPRFRKECELPVKDLLVGLSARALLDSDASVMTGNMRNTKGLNDLTYNWGAIPLMRNVIVHGEESDLVGFFRNTIKLASREELLEPMNDLWNGREIIGKEPRAAVRRAA